MHSIAVCHSHQRLSSPNLPITLLAVPVASLQSSAAPNKDGTNCDGELWTGGLVHLWVQRNKLRELPLEGVNADAGLSQQAPNLTSLDASHNQLSTFGSPAAYPPGLTYLDLASNQIGEVGDDE